MNSIFYFAAVVFFLPLILALFINADKRIKWLVTVGLFVFLYLLAIAYNCVQSGVSIVQFMPCLLYSFISFLGIPYLMLVVVGTAIGVTLSAWKDRLSE